MKNKRREHHEEHIDETWLIPYADLLTLLLALFIILFASSQIDSKKYDQIMRGLNSALSGGTNIFEVSSSPIENLQEIDQKKADVVKKQDQKALEEQQKHQVEMEDLKELQQKLEGYIKDNKLSTQLETKLTEDMLKITIRDNALFQPGSADINKESQKLAQSIAGMLSGYKEYNVEVAGFTDNRPINNREFQSNWDLSAKRSLNFMKILINNDKIDPSHYRSIGYGEYQPIDTNDTVEGRSKNRRVEVNIIRQVKSTGEKSFIP
ncbi:flagellar motor protein MotB [Paenibacillus eucommiae]|uniref:Chemotaxis protein MotB n=1 Tax=Paenibacillus eucommiae TaxID=1355755 RepID=A0ABS4IVD3_9BACL|nr:flagellar motor protein MotB [Paenibacillus eucommiae]MBP1991551.1 chemotaxis protein MotB [Paenibacillus eucommiae]